MSLHRNNRATSGPFFKAPPATDPETAQWLANIDREVPATHLTPADKSAVWRQIKTEHPEREAFFADPLVKQLLSEGAVPTFPPELIAAARRKANQR